ncbi:MAG: TolC family protein [Desulfobulbaceae bacterium]|jgi:outer membrane protein|nr:TolC family protein [Desulfobulbaceae bacterium]
MSNTTMHLSVLQRRNGLREALELGLASRADMLEAKARLGETKTRLLVVDRDRLSAVRNLQRRIGRLITPENFPILDEDTYHVNEWVAEEWVQRTVENNVGLLVAQMEKEIAQSELTIKKAGYYPNVMLSASISDSYNEDLGISQGADKRVSVALQVPLFKGGYTSASVDQAVSTLQQARALVRNALESATVEVYDDLASLEIGESNIIAWQQVVNARVSTLNAVAASNQQGFKDMVAVLDAQSRLNDARRALNQSISSHLLQQVRLYATAGVLFEQDLQRVDSLLQPASL